MLNFRLDRSCLDAASVLLCVIFAVEASADTIFTFDALADGEAVSGQLPGVTVTANNPHGDAPDAAVVYNFTAYPELAYGGQQHDGGWSGGNVADFNTLGKGLAIAGPDPAKVLEPRRPAGELRFTFDDPVSSFGFSVVDVEGPSEFNTDTGYFIDFVKDGVSVLELDFADFITPGSPYYDASIAFGDHTANRINPIRAAQVGVAGFDSVGISLGGSSVLGDVRYESAPTPTAILGGLTLMGLALTRRRDRLT